VKFRVRNAYIILVRIFGGKRPLGRPRRRCDDNIKMNKTLCHVISHDVEVVDLMYFTIIFFSEVL
jgi:hypothetical protein